MRMRLIVALAVASLSAAFAVAAWADDGSVNQSGSNVANNTVVVGGGGSTQVTHQEVVSVSGSNGTDGSSSVSVRGSNGANGASVSTSVTGSNGSTGVSCSITTKTVGNVTTTTQTGDCSGFTITPGGPLPAVREAWISTLWLWFRSLCR